MKTKIIALKRRLVRISRHLVAILDGSASSLAKTTDPMRYTFAAHGLRELLREVLAKLAPDTEIKLAKWFLPDSSAPCGITRRHRTTFAVYGFVHPDVLPKHMADAVDDLASKIAEHIKQLSEYSHVTESSLAKSPSRGDALVESSLDLFLSLFDAIKEGRDTLIDELQMAISDHLDSLFFNDFFDELDCLSSHTRIDRVENVEVTIESIDEERINFTGTGTVTCELQYGSDSDVDHGDGLVNERSFPFTFQGSTSTTDLKDIEVDRGSIEIDTSSYYE